MRWSLSLAPAGAIAATCLFGSILPAAASAVLQTNLPGVAVEGDDLLVALPIQNAGNTTALRVVVTEVELAP